MKRRGNGNGQRDRLLMKTYGNAPLGSKTHRTGASSDAFGSQSDRGFTRENSFSPLKNNYLGTEGVTFVIPRRCRAVNRWSSQSYHEVPRHQRDRTQRA